MRLTTLLVVLACGCATSSATGAPPGGAGEPADAKGRGWRSPASESGAAGGGPVSVAVATLEPKSGSKVTGTARITPSASGVDVLVSVQDAAPGEHGVHIHEKGDCSDPAAQSAGPHFNPKSAAHHGGANTPVRHGGDLGNMKVSSSGRGLLAVTVSDLTMDNASGRAVVVHEKADDLQSDPAGNSGNRVACGVL